MGITILLNGKKEELVDGMSISDLFSDIGRNANFDDFSCRI